MTAAKNMILDYGVFAENITTEGLALRESKMSNRFENNTICLEITQSEKKCHKGCEIMKEVHDCVMPREGIFCKVIKGGTLNVSDTLNYIPNAD